MLPNSWFKKEKPLLGLTGMGGGVAGTLVGAGAGAWDASGGIISEYDEGGKRYKSHIFLASGSFVVNSVGSTDLDFIVVGGGGGGACLDGGGGGAGGYRSSTPEGPGGPSPTAESALTLQATTYPVTVGYGGNGVDLSPNIPLGTYAFGLDGSYSQFGSPTQTYIRSEGGGGGGGSASPTYGYHGRSGGSGGGGSGWNGPNGGLLNNPGLGNRAPQGANAAPTDQPTTAVPNQGYDGGNGFQDTGNDYRGGGGGGAGAVGENGKNNGGPTSGNGGVGKPFTTIGSYPGMALGAGGAGGQQEQASGNAPGGNNSVPIPGYVDYSNGIGGRGGNGPGIGPGPGKGRGLNAIHSTGSGGGGYMLSQSESQGMGAGQGSDGVVIVRYEIAQATGTAKATGGDISFNPDGTKCFHCFRYGGTFVTTAAIPSAEVFILAGGGGGGAPYGGGGGSGGYVYYPTISFPYSSGSPNNTNTIKVGEGGKGGGGGGLGISNYTQQGMPGEPSKLNQPSITYEVGGGGGGGGYKSPPGPGYGNGVPGTPGTAGTGSGGGGGAGNPGAGPGGSGGPGGNNGGPGKNEPSSTGGGGGGAGGVGETGVANNAGNGGIGVQLPATFLVANSGSEFGFAGPTAGGGWLAGGGGGAAETAYPTSQPEGIGGGGPNPANPWAGGGNGGAAPGGFWAGGNGGNGSGGGGGAGGRNPGRSSPRWPQGPSHATSPNPTESGGGRGGSGIVLIAYPT